jgi:hypothetical protein
VILPTAKKLFISGKFLPVGAIFPFPECILQQHNSPAGHKINLDWPDLFFFLKSQKRLQGWSVCKNIFTSQMT